MASFFNTTATLEHKTPIPAGIALSKAVEMLHNHEFYIKCDPHMIKYEAIETSSDPRPTIPESRQREPIAPATTYRVTDQVHALPAGLWDSDVVSTYVFMKVERGVFVQIASPLSTSMETLWEIRDTADGGLEIVEDILIKSSRLLIGVVKSTCETGWNGIHMSMVKKLQEES